MLSEEQFAQLQTEFMKRALKKRDVFLNSTPKELQRFNEFLEQNGPFDVVIDGLNVSNFAQNQSVQQKTQHVRMFHKDKSVSCIFNPGQVLPGLLVGLVQDSDLCHWQIAS